jgi:16S rRNA A1518/A1519 N6-dimethyltransferase RsmA/KsgA/DIM1 with predicted DNA glycosylase/AP lyase activity
MTILLIIKISLLIALLLLSLFFLMFSVFNMFLAAPFVPSSRKAARKMIDAANFMPDDVVYDLGSGDGRLVLMAAKKGVKDAVGFEINPALNVFARIKARFMHLKNTTFLTKSLWKADLSNCNKLLLYLLPKSMQQLESKILKEMPKGSYVISNSFSLRNLEPIKTIDTIKVYRID